MRLGGGRKPKQGDQEDYKNRSERNITEKANMYLSITGEPY